MLTILAKICESLLLEGEEDKGNEEWCYWSRRQTVINCIRTFIMMRFCNLLSHMWSVVVGHAYLAEVYGQFLAYYSQSSYNKSFYKELFFSSHFHIKNRPDFYSNSRCRILGESSSHNLMETRFQPIGTRIWSKYKANFRLKDRTNYNFFVCGLASTLSTNTRQFAYTECKRWYFLRSADYHT